MMTQRLRFVLVAPDVARMKPAVQPDANESNMQSYQQKQQLIAFLKACLECSVYIAPTEPGLTYDELLEAGKRAGYQPGQISDAMQDVTTIYFGRQNRRLQPERNDTALWLHFGIAQEDPDFRNPDAFDFVFDQLRTSVNANGARNAKLERSVIVEREISMTASTLARRALLFPSRFRRGGDCGEALPSVDRGNQDRLPYDRCIEIELDDRVIGRVPGRLPDFDRDAWPPPNACVAAFTTGERSYEDKMMPPVCSILLMHTVREQSQKMNNRRSAFQRRSPVMT